MQSKAWVYGCSLAGVAGSNPAGGMMSVCCKCCVLSGRGLCVGVLVRPEECGVSECDLKALIMRRPWPTSGLLCHEKIN